ncbi:MAG: response regulator, partial [Psychromonas sp.]
MRLLIVEDEQKTGEYLKKGLTESSFRVDLAINGIDGLHQAMSEEYDLIILDVMLPKLNGWQVLQTLRSSKIDTPVLMLTARDQIEDRVKGLELGADDYLVKPFAFVELLARIRNILKRNNNNIAHDATTLQ